MLGYLLAVAAAGVNAVSSILQRAAARKEPARLELRVQLMVRLLHRPLWLLGLAAVTASFLLQAFALSRGALASIEPVLGLELPVTVLLSARVFHRRLGRSELLAVVGITLGLAVLLASLAPSGGDAGSVPGPVWAVGLATTLVVIGALVHAGARAADRERRAAVWGVATGMGFGLTAALMKAMTLAARHDWFHLFSAWQTYAMAVVGVGSMFLAGNAVNAGSLVAAQPGFTAADPLTAILWGTVVLGEQVTVGWNLVPAAAGFAAVVISAVVLARSLRSASAPP